MSSLVLRVKEVIAETADAHSLVFEGPALPYKPGQFLTLRIPSDRQPTARCYSLSSAPGVDELLKVTVKRTVGGYGSNWVCDSVVAGSEIEVLAPTGLFTPRDLSADLLLLAGGSGITPVMSIVKSALATGTGQVVLVYANRDEASVIFASELAALSREHPERLVVHHWLESVQGLPTPAQLAAQTRHCKAHDVFVCGPAPFMEAVEKAMATIGATHVHVERFVSLAGDPFTAGVVEIDESGPTATVHVTLNDEQHELAWPTDTKLLDLLEAKGLDAPWSCREGNCSACGFKLLEGEVSMIANNVLEQQDLDEGWRLGCQSLPVSDVVRVTYDD